MIQIFLTCTNDREAEKIARVLLEKKLVVCTKRFPVSSLYRWKGKVESSDEVMLIMDTIENNFEKIRKEVAKLHSYKTFVLVSSPISQTSKGVKDWVKEELG